MDKYNEIAKMLHILPRLNHYIHEGFNSQLDLTVNQNELKALIEIDIHPLRAMAHYAKMLAVENGSFTYLADKLEKKGLIKRLTAKNDKRKTVLELTDEGKQVTNMLRVEFESHVAQRITGLNKDDLNELKQAIECLENILEKLENN